MSSIDYARKLAAPASWILILGIVATVAYRIHSLVYLPTSGPIANSQVQPSATPQKATSTDIKAITDLHLFGKPIENVATRPESVTNAQATRLPLELIAVFAASENSYSAAIIGQRGQRARLYAVGDGVPGNAELAEVYADQVLLRRAGKLESLAFAKSSFTAASTVAQAPVDSSKQQPKASRPAKSRSTQKSTKPTPKMLADSRRIANELSNNPEQAAAQLGLSASPEGGYKISNVADSPYFQRAGLKSGDVILSINGRSMSDTKPTQAMLDELMASGSARVVLLRNNDRLTITASIPNQR